MNKNPILFNSSGGVPRNRSRNFNRRHHHHLGTRKSQRAASNKHRRTRRISELVFMTQNVQGLKQDFTDLDILTHYIEKQTWKSQASITFLSECRLKTTKKLQVKNHEIFIHGESSSTGGVGIVLNKHATLAWKAAGSQPPIAIKGRIMGLHLEFGQGKNRTKFFVVSTYLPCTGSQHHDFDTIVDDLTHLIERECKKGVKPIIGGDLNARLGNRSHYGENVAKCLGPHGIQQDINDRGRTITNFLQQLKLCNPASYYPISKKTTTPHGLVKMSKKKLRINSTL